MLVCIYLLYHFDVCVCVHVQAAPVASSISGGVSALLNPVEACVDLYLAVKTEAVSKPCTSTLPLRLLAVCTTLRVLWACT